MKKRKLFIAALVLAMTVMLAGCAKMDMHVKINKDLTGTINVKFGMADELYNMAGLKPEDLLNKISEVEALKDAALAGVNISTYKEDGYSGIVVSAKVRDFSKQIDSVSLVTKKDGTIRFELPTQYLSQSIEEIGGKLGKIMDGVKITLSVELPEEVTENNANVISEDRKTLTWNVLDIGSDTMYAECDVDKISDIVWIIIAGVVVLVAATVIILVVSGTKKKNSKENPSEADGAESLQESIPEENQEETEQKETTED